REISLVVGAGILPICQQHKGELYLRHAEHISAREAGMREGAARETLRLTPAKMSIRLQEHVDDIRADVRLSAMSAMVEQQIQEDLEIGSGRKEACVSRDAAVRVP